MSRKMSREQRNKLLVRILCGVLIVALLAGIIVAIF